MTKILSKAEGDRLVKQPLKWGKYSIIFCKEGGSPNMTTCSFGYMYSHIWSAKAFGIVGKGFETPRAKNGWVHCAILDVETGEIVWRNYAD